MKTDATIPTEILLIARERLTLDAYLRLRRSERGLPRVSRRALLDTFAAYERISRTGVIHSGSRVYHAAVADDSRAVALFEASFAE